MTLIAPKCHRKGTTLVELIVVITLTALILSTVAVTLNAMYDIDNQVRDDVARMTNWGRLSIALRRDAHTAQSAKVVDSTNYDPSGSKALELKISPTRRIVYTRDERAVIRQVYDDDLVTHQDGFSLRPDVEPVWQVDTGGHLPMAVMTAVDAEGQSMGSSIEAAVGLDSRQIPEDQP